jgi:hypothetical protein
VREVDEYLCWGRVAVQDRGDGLVEMAAGAQVDLASRTDAGGGGMGSVVMRSATLFKPFTSADLVACA